MCLHQSADPFHRKADFMNKQVKIVMIVVVICGLGLLVWNELRKWHQEQTAAAVAQVRMQYRGTIDELNQKIAELEARLAKETAGSALGKPEKELIANVFGDQTDIGALGDTHVNCSEIDKQARALFDYLDQKGYAKEAGLDLPVAKIFDQAMDKLSQHRPLLTDELGSTLRLLQNVTHFYRVLGSKPIRLTNAILGNESQILEPAMAVLYAWLTTCNRQDQSAGEAFDLETFYTYAGYVLNTLGGRSYLLRRDSRFRILINYYAVLLLDQANQAKLNSYGIDIRPYIDYLLYDLTNQKGLLYQKRYLSQLAALQRKYP